MAQIIANPAAPNTTDKGLDNVVQLHRLLRKAGLREDAYQRVRDEPNFRDELVRFWNGETTPEIAAEIMGRNFHGIDALEKHLGVKLSAKSKKLFLTVPFSDKVLQACCKTHVLVACGALSLMDTWRAQPDLFYHRFSPWYGYPSEQFARSRIKASWQLVRKSPVPDSTSKTWDEQNALLGQDDQVPSASVLAQCILIHYLETGGWLCYEAYVRVSDVDSNGRRVDLGNSGGVFLELGVGGSWDDSPGIDFGLSSSRKFSRPLDL